ncbi:hypothetical protein ACFQDF_27035 [Ectobacillus funiculus]
MKEILENSQKSNSTKNPHKLSLGDAKVEKSLYEVFTTTPGIYGTAVYGIVRTVV